RPRHARPDDPGAAGHPARRAGVARSAGGCHDGRRRRRGGCRPARHGSRSAAPPAAFSHPRARGGGAEAARDRRGCARLRAGGRPAGAALPAWGCGYGDRGEPDDLFDLLRRPHRRGSAGQCRDRTANDCNVEHQRPLRDARPGGVLAAWRRAVECSRGRLGWAAARGAPARARPHRGPPGGGAMKVLTRYLLKSHIGPLVFAFVALTGVILIDSLVRSLGDLAGKGLPAPIFLVFFLLSLPANIALTLPMSVLVAVLFAFSQMAAENEISALRASGVDLRRMVLPLLLVASLIAGGMIWFNNEVLPAANYRWRVLMTDVAQTSPLLFLQPQIINSVNTGDGSQRYYIQAADIDEA